ncbi:hypothetical protein RJT34_13598 [Clitoria ternatea]|uniref:DUF4408 domain-containing protein n=1 Tax=Clitoria ternatea TaxID=43366 RepID=A0AAN9PMF1_CLITE
MLSLKVKLVLISITVLFTALGVKASLPLATTHLPLLWTFLLLCFKPPYLFLILNAIIISILASSRFHHPQPPLLAPEIQITPKLTISEPPLVELKPLLAIEYVQEEEVKEIDDGRKHSMEIPSPTEKPLVSARFTNRKPVKYNPEGGRALRVVGRAKRHETLENTWKAITEGRSMPLSRHIKKCDTWQNRGHVGPVEASVNKSETFNDRTNSKQVHQVVGVSGAGRLRKEPSLSQDELNRRVEAFIRKFNEDMRLQRQQSLEQYMQMINRGAG